MKDYDIIIEKAQSLFFFKITKDLSKKNYLWNLFIVIEFC